MAVFTMHELSQNACETRRAFSFPVKEKQGEVYKKVVATKSIIKDMLQFNIALSEVDKLVEERFKEIEYLSPMQKEINQYDTARQIRRYVASERRLAEETGRKIYPLGQKEVELTPDVSVIVSPDYYCFNNDAEQIEVIKLRCSKPYMTAKKAKEDLGMYAMLKYAEILAKANPKVTTIVASMYFLGKASDKFTFEKEHFDSDFFLNPDGKNNAGGLNVVQVVKAISEMPKTDADFLPVLNRFADGVAEEDCKQEDCEKCILHDICKFEAAPTILEEPPQKRKTVDELYLMLTENQKKAIDFRDGYCVINAGAGSGKTQSMAMRVASMMTGMDGQEEVAPEKFCLITFTKSGAEAMRHRISDTLVSFYQFKYDMTEEAAKELAETEAAKLTIQTFNAFGDDIVKEQYKFLGFMEEPTVIDDVERSQILARLLNEEAMKPYTDEKGKKALHPLKLLDWRNFYMDTASTKGALTIAKLVFDYMKQEHVDCTVEDTAYAEAGSTVVARYMENIHCSKFYRRDMRVIKELVKLFAKYESMLFDENKIEYADQEAMIFDVVSAHPFYFDKYGFEHIIVDEFQDTTENQIRIVKFLCDTKFFKSLMVVGDDSQAIFGFRNTSPKFIIDFEKYIGKKSVEHIELMENFRSTPEILEFANKINQKNKYRVEKDLKACRPNGKPVVVKGFYEPKKEQKFVVEGIQEHINDGIAPEDIAIICYGKNELSRMAGKLDELGIPNVMLNPEKIADNSRVLAAKALVKAIEEPEATKDALVYANALIGGGMLHMPEEEMLIHMTSVLEKLDIYRLTVDEEAKKEMLMNMLKDIDPKQDEIYETFLETLERKSVEDIFTYVKAFDAYGSTLAIRREQKYPGVVLTTAHSSKGLEWKIVYNMISAYDFGETRVSCEEFEERRRLLFVSSTRAKDELYVTGQYISYSRDDDYVLNKFLEDAFDAVGDALDEKTVTDKKQEMEAERVAAKQKQRKAKAKKDAEALNEEGR